MISLEQLHFCAEYASNGGNATKAMLVCRPHLSIEDAGNIGGVILAQPEIQKYINEKRNTNVQHPVFCQVALTQAEKRAFCAAVVRATPKDLNHDSPLVEEVSYTSDGSTKYKMMSKAKALAIDNAMSGHNAPIVTASTELDLDGLLERVTGQRVIEAELVSEETETSSLQPWD